MPAIELTEAALKVLKDCTVEGSVVKLPPDQLSRDLYQQVRKHLELIGGKWKGGKTYGFVFEYSGDQLQELLDAQANGDGRNLKKEFQFFATPPELAQRMVVLASNNNRMLPGTKVLEPSAGSGALCSAILKYTPVKTVDCYELMDVNRIKLSKVKGARLVGPNFLDAVELDMDENIDPVRGQYDIIIANPPFANNQDIDHIRAMYRACRNNGRIVTVASMSWKLGSQKKQLEFQKWLDELDAYQEELPRETFKDSGTTVGAMLLVIDKQEAAEEQRLHEVVIPDPITIIGAPELTREEQLPEPVVILKQIEESMNEAAVHLQNIKGLLNNTNNMKKITIPASPLLEVLKKVKEVVSQKPSMPILSNMLFKVRRTDIQIIATDLMVTIIGNIDVTNIGDNGYEYLLPFDYLYNIGMLTNGLDLTIEIDDVQKKVDGKKVEVTNAVLTTITDTFKQDDLDNPVEFPAVPEFPSSNCVGIGGDFILWLNKAIDTVSGNSSNLAMHKIYVGIANEGLAMASTNAHVVFEKTFKSESQHTKDLLVDTKIAKALKSFKETSISWNDSHLAFVANGITMIGRVQDEKFPNYRDVFPNDPPANLRLSLAEITAVMKKAALTQKPATIYLKREIGHIVVESFDEIYNRKVTVRIGADYSGECEQIMVNPENMLLLLGQIEYTNITLSITGPDKPIIITSESDPTYRSLTMPLA